MRRNGVRGVSPAFSETFPSIFKSFPSTTETSPAFSESTSNVKSDMYWFNYTSRQHNTRTVSVKNKSWSPSPG